MPDHGTTTTNGPVVPGRSALGVGTKRAQAHLQVAVRAKYTTSREKEMNRLKVKDVMTHFVVALGPRDTIKQAAQQLLSNRISGTPVVDKGKLVGIVSETDLVQTYAQAARGTSFLGSPNRLMSLPPGAPAWEVNNTTVGDVMTLEVVSIPPEASVWEAASLMHRREVRRLPVVDADDYVVGVLTRSDLVRAMARSDEEITASVQKAFGVLGRENFLALQVETQGGTVSVRGIAVHRSTKELAIHIAAQVAGVLKVFDHLEWQLDDTYPRAAKSPFPSGSQVVRGQPVGGGSPGQ